MASSDSCGGSSSSEPGNEDIAEEFGLDFSDLNELERQILLRWRRVGLRPSKDHPTATSQESFAAESSSQLSAAANPLAAIPSRRLSTDW